VIQGYLTAVLVIMLICGLWLAVQRFWGRQFPERTGPDGDVLSGRGGCRGCTCSRSGCGESSTTHTRSEAD
jgi:hypothetical protein